MRGVETGPFPREHSQFSRVDKGWKSRKGRAEVTQDSATKNRNPGHPAIYSPNRDPTARARSPLPKARYVFDNVFEGARMENRDSGADMFVFCSPVCGKQCYANGLRAVPINTCIKDFTPFFL